MNISHYFERLAKGENLSALDIETILGACLSGQLTDIQIAAFLAMMRQKGETVEELKAAAKTMQKHAHHLSISEPIIDIVGTGGDNKSTFNVSTCTAFVIAGSGVKVAKHGNRSVSSKSGSADLLELAGIKLSLPDDTIKHCIQTCHIAFLYAPHYHPAMKYAANARRELGIRTLFNLLGPLLNPAQPKKQIIGVYESKWMSAIAEVLISLGSETTLVVNAQDGMDEISIAAKTNILEYRQGKMKTWILDPQSYGLAHANIDDIVVQNANESLDLIQAVLKGRKGPARDIVLLNAAAAIYCASDNVPFEKALCLAEKSLDSGQALQSFEKLQQLSHKFAHE
jgi:anthranilate phosphoribosyltransferase